MYFKWPSNETVNMTVSNQHLEAQSKHDGGAQ